MANGEGYKKQCWRWMSKVGYHFKSVSQFSGFCMLGSPCTGPEYGFGVYLVSWCIPGYSGLFLSLITKQILLIKT